MWITHGFSKEPRIDERIVGASGKSLKGVQGLKSTPRSQKLYGSENGKIEKIPFSTLSGQRNLSLY